MKQSFKTICHSVDFCVVGGGMAGLCAAVSAARNGARTLLMQERPVLGGNASSEIRMWICGARGEQLREGGLLEEIQLENHYRNPEKNYAIWDSILYEMAAYQENLKLLLNCTCQSCDMDENRIMTVTGWQMTTQTYHRVEAKLFADCSGDSVLAPLCGAEYRVGRECRAEFCESIAPLFSDRKTMGMSCLMQAREEERPSDFIPPVWAHHYTAERLHQRVPDLTDPSENFWYLELGGEQDSIADTETLRDELLRVAYGVWDYVKNAPENKEKNRNWHLEWVGMLPGKRESRRYLGDYLMTENDVLSGGRFKDVIAYGGWPMDDHDPRGFLSQGEPNVFHPAPSPFGIPYRSLYSCNVENLFFAGRNISVTHAAMSSTRVMATCALLGQAVGTAAAIAVKHGLTPRGVYDQRLETLQQTLLWQDCYLPDVRRKPSEAMIAAKLPAKYEALRNGWDRPVGGQDNGCRIALNEEVAYTFETPVSIECIRLVFDSDFDRKTLSQEESALHRSMLCNRPLNWPDSRVPATLTRAYRLIVTLPDGSQRVVEEAQNHRRLRFHEIHGDVVKAAFVATETWGAEDCHLFSFELC